MTGRGLVLALGLLTPVALAQTALASLPAKTALPVMFTQTVSADHAHVGDVVLAKTTQVVRLSDGVVVPAGSKVVGHVVAAAGFAFDKTPYAQQKTSQLAIAFDRLEAGGVTFPLHVTVRALASPLAVDAAYTPLSNGYDILSPRTLVGGDKLVPSQDEVRDGNGDVVAYNRRDGVYAHLISSGRCDGGDVEVSVDVFSPTACGLYGFGRVTLGSVDEAQLSLVSAHGAPQIWKHTMALLEVVAEGGR